MHSLLSRQLRRAFVESATVNICSYSPAYEKLFSLISDAYASFESDRELLERSLQLTSEELEARNRMLMSQNAELQEAERDLRKSHESLEKRVAERTEELRETMKRAESANRAKSAFLANMSHEIRTPLTAILGYADMLLDNRGIVGEELEWLQTIRRQGEHLLALLNDILDISKIEADKLVTERIACDPCRLVGDVISLMRVRAREKNLYCEVSYLGEIPQFIMTDPTRLRQILINLIGNAVKFTDSGGVHIGVSLDRPSSGPAKLRIEVTDSGIGLEPQEMEKLFKPFVQGDESTTRRFGGTGLGLSICKRLAQMLDGDLVAQSRLSCGSRFTLTVGVGSLEDVALRPAPYEAAQQLPKSAIAGGDGKSREAQCDTDIRLQGSVLLAEDGIHNQRVIRYFLESAGLRVTIVENGRMAYDAALAAKASGSPFDLILMDMQMPELDGYQATELLRGEAYTGPIIAVTASAMVGDREKCLASGCDEHLTKPVDRRQLLAQLSKRLAPRPSDARSNPTPSSSPAAVAVPTEPPAAMTTAPPAAHLRSMRICPIEKACVEFLPAFLASLPDEAAGLMAAIGDADLSRLKRLLHGLKGTSGLFGLQEIHAQVASAESLIIESAQFEAVVKHAQAIAEMLRAAAQLDPQQFPVRESSKAPMPVACPATEHSR